MNKLEMAHEYAKIMLDKSVNLDGENREDYLNFITQFSHDLSDEMVAEHSERIDRSRPDAIVEKTVVVRDGGYYHDHVNFEYYKLTDGKWFKTKSLLDPIWIECDEPVTTWLVENDTYK